MQKGPKPQKYEIKISKTKMSKTKMSKSKNTKDKKFKTRMLKNKTSKVIKYLKPLKK
jgi:hypothetical protein